MTDTIAELIAKLRHEARYQMADVRARSLPSDNIKEDDCIFAKAADALAETAAERDRLRAENEELKERCAKAADKVDTVNGIGDIIRRLP